MKKLLSLFLALVMALSLCTTAFAGSAAGTSVIRLTGDAADQVVDLKNGQRLSTDSSTLVRLNVLDDPSVEEYTVTLDGEKLTPDHSTSQYHFYAVPAAQASGVATLNVSSGVSTQALEGDGTAENPYKIATAADLKEFRDKVNGGATTACAKLTADITLDKSETWTPIGSSKNKYNGTFDGQGYTISGLNVNETGSNEAGLFGDTAQSNTSPVIKNLTIADSSFVTASGYAGAFAGWGGGVFENCHTEANVTVQGKKFAGGIIGSYKGSGMTAELSMIQCSNRATVKEVGGYGGYAGGLIGQVEHPLNLENSFNAGAVSSKPSSSAPVVGGLVGTALLKANFTDVYNVGSVSISSAGQNIGGLIGQTASGKAVTIKNAYQHGTVANKDGTGAAIVGNAAATVTLTNVYKTGSLNDNLLGSSITGKAVTKTEDELKELAAQLGGSFINDMAGDAAVNNGFPIFRWQNVAAASADTLKVTAKDQSGTAALDSEGSTDPTKPTEKTISFECDFLNTFAADRIYLTAGEENKGTLEFGLALSATGELTQTLTKQKNGYTADELYFYRLPGVVTHTVYAVHTQDGTARYYKINVQRTAISTNRYGAISADWRDDNPVIQTTYNPSTGYLDATVKVSDHFAWYKNGVLDETIKAASLLTSDKPFMYYGYNVSALDNDGNQTVQFANVGRFWMSNKSATDSLSSIPAAVWWGSKDVAEKYIAAANALKTEAGYSKLPTELKNNFDAAIKAVSDGWNEDTAKPLYLDANGSYTTAATELKARDAMGAPMTGEYKLEYQENLLLDYMYIIKTYLNDSTLGSLKYRALQNVVKGVNRQANDRLKTVSAMAITDDATRNNYVYYQQRVWRIVNATDIGEINSMLKDLNLSAVELDITSDAMQVIVGGKTYDVDLSKAVDGTVTINVPRSEAMQRIYFTRTADVTIKSPTMEALQGKGAYTGTDFGLYFYNTPAEQKQEIKISVNENGTVNEYTIAIVCPAADGVVLGPSGTGGNYREDQPGNMGSVDTSGEYYAYGFVIATDGTTSYDGMKLYTNGKRSDNDIRPDWTSLAEESNKLYYANGIYAYFARPGYYWLPVTTTVGGKTVEGLLPMRASWTRDAVASYLKYAEATEPPVRGSMSDEAQELYAQVFNTVSKAAGIDTGASTNTLGTPLYLTVNGDVPTTTASATTVRARSYFGAPLYGASLIEEDMNTLLDLTYMCANTWSTNATLAEQQFEAYQQILNMDNGIHNVMDIHSTADRDLYQKIRQAKWDLIHTTNEAGINTVLNTLGLGTTEPEHTLGDVNGDGEITMFDATLIINHVRDVAPITDEKTLKAADVNGDGEITMFDATLIINHVRDIKALS